MTYTDRKDIERMKELVKAIRFNHDVSGPFIATVNSTTELKNYRSRLPQLTLPRRFKMAKTQVKDVPEKNDVEMEDPEPKPDSTYTTPEGHKRRDIFAS